MAAVAFGPTVQDIVSSWVSGKTFKAMLVGSGYTPDVDAHDFRADVTSEVSGTGYTAGGITLTSVAVSVDTATNKVKLTAANANFGTLTVTGITGIVVYVSTGSAATDRILSHHSFTNSSPSGVNFTYQWHADGIGTFTY